MWKRLTGKYYVKGYLDGYSDAEAEFLDNEDYAITAYNNGYEDGVKDSIAMNEYMEDVDVAYWQGYNNAMVDAHVTPVEDVSTNKDNE